MNPNIQDRIIGCFLGVAIGDALGASVEMKSAEYIVDKYGRITDYLSPKHKKIRKSETTDDWQLTAATATALLGAGGLNMDKMAYYHIEAMRDSTKGWGGTTKGAVKNLESGISWKESGISREGKGAGNGVCMKLAPLAIWSLGADIDYKIFINQFTRMTHDTEIAVVASAAMMEALQFCLRTSHIQSKDDFVFSGEGTLTKETIPQVKVPFDKEGFSLSVSHAVRVMEHSFDIREDDVTQDHLSDVINSVALDTDLPEDYFNNQIKKTKGGCYVYESLPFSLLFFLSNPDSIESLFDVVSAGGDTDTNGSIVGSLLGAYHGKGIFPDYLVDGLTNKKEVLDLACDFVDFYFDL